jgi:hypothetical protein
MLLQAQQLSPDTELDGFIFVMGTAIILAVGVILVFIYALESFSDSGQVEYMDVSDQTTDPWRELTREHDMEFVAGAFGDDPKHVTGEYRGKSVEVYEEHRREKSPGTTTDKTYTHYEIGLPSFLPDEMALYDPSLAQNLETLFGGRELQVGHAKLDETFVIRGDEPDAIRDFLECDDLAGSLIDLTEVWDEFELERGTLTIATEGRVFLTHEDALDDLVDAVEHIRKAGPPDSTDSEGHVADFSET